MFSIFIPLFDVFLTCFHLFYLSLCLFLSCVFCASFLCRSALPSSVGFFFGVRGEEGGFTLPLSELMFVQVVYLNATLVRAMFPTASCLPMAVV